MALMVGNGAQAGALSRFAPTGIIVNGIMERSASAATRRRPTSTTCWRTLVVTFVAYFMFGGWKLFTRRRAGADRDGAIGSGRRARRCRVVDVEPFEAAHWLTLAVLVDAGGRRDPVPGARRAWRR